MARIDRQHLSTPLSRPPEDSALERVIEAAAAALARCGMRLATAESCTGGLIAAHCTSIPGSSDWFEAAFVTYTMAAKTALLGVSQDLIFRYGVVSEPVARAMAEGALMRCSADVVVSVTGIAGPGGGELQAPVGTVWFAWKRRDEPLIHSAGHCLPGDRAHVRNQAVLIALSGVVELLQGS